MNEFYCTGEIRPYYRKGMSFPENFHFTVPIFLSVVLYAGGVYWRKTYLQSVICRWIMLSILWIIWTRKRIFRLRSRHLPRRKVSLPTEKKIILSCCWFPIKQCEKKSVTLVSERSSFFQRVCILRNWISIQVCININLPQMW